MGANIVLICAFLAISLRVKVSTVGVSEENFTVANVRVKLVAWITGSTISSNGIGSFAQRVYFLT